jgi:hypothetical protein
MLSLVDRAIGFAARAHDGQKRKTGNVPYIAHPVAVAMILQEMGCDETIIAAGLLHDTVEDTKVTLGEIRQQFGDEVADIVAGCTEPSKRKMKWEERKLHTIHVLRDAPLAVKLVAASDKYHNLIHTRYTEGQIGAFLWEVFGRGKDKQAWYYRSVLESLKANVDNLDDYPIFAMLEEVVDELFAGVHSQPPG